MHNNNPNFDYKQWRKDSRKEFYNNPDISFQDKVRMFRRQLPGMPGGTKYVKALVDSDFRENRFARRNPYVDYMQRRNIGDPNLYREVYEKPELGLSFKNGGSLGFDPYNLKSNNFKKQ